MKQLTIKTFAALFVLISMTSGCFAAETVDVTDSEKGTVFSEETKQERVSEYILTEETRAVSEDASVDKTPEKTASISQDKEEKRDIISGMTSLLFSAPALLIHQVKDTKTERNSSLWDLW